MSCLFCRLVAGEIPSTRIYEDATTLAFLDINPGTRGHALVIPKVHAENIHDVPAEVLADMARTAQRVANAARAHLGCAGVNLAQSSGAAATQTVFHIHIHVIPRYEGDTVRLSWPPSPSAKNDIADTAEKLRRGLNG